MVQVVPADPGWGEAFQGLGKGLVGGYQNRSDEMALQKSISALGENPTPQAVLKAVTGTRTYNPEAKANFFKQFLGAAKLEETSSKAALQREKERNEILQGEQLGEKLGLDPQLSAGKTPDQIIKINKALNPKGKVSSKDQTAEHNSLIADGWPDYLADLYQQSPPGVQNRMMADHIEAKNRGLRKPTAITKPEDQGTETGKAGEITPVEDKDAIIAGEAIAKEAPEWPEIPPPENITPAEKVKWENGNQKENNKILFESKKKSQSQQHISALLNRANQLNDSKEIPEGIGKFVINPETGEPYAVASLLGIVNKQTQDFVKTINDFLIGAKDLFGAKVSNFEVSSFKSRLPTLMNTTEGRRLIIKQMQLLSELDAIHKDALEDGLKHYGRKASYSDIQKIVDDKITSKEQTVINKLNEIDTASDYMDMMAKDPKFKGSVLMQDKEGRFKGIPKNRVDEFTKKGYTVY